MMKRLSKFISTTLLNANYISEQDLPIYTYCFEYILENLTFTVFILFYSMLLKRISIGILFLSILMSIRSFAGGIHAPTKQLCNILSYGISMITIAVASAVTTRFEFLWIPTFFISCFVIKLLCPIDTPNKRLDNQQKSKLKGYCNITLIIFIILFSIFYLSDMVLYYGTISICFLIVSTSVMLGHINNQRSIKHES